MDEVVRQYMAEIGRRGGSAGKGTKWRQEVCRHAAVVRWRAYRARKKKAYERAEAKKAEEQRRKDETLEAHSADVHQTLGRTITDEELEVLRKTADQKKDEEEAIRKALLA